LAHDGRRTRSWRAPDIAIFDAGLLVRARLAASLTIGFESLVELLPFDVEGEDWTMIHCTDSVADLDEQRSDVDRPPVPNPTVRYVFPHRRVVLKDKGLQHGAPFVIDGTSRGPVYCGAGFRSKVLSMGLVGVQFREVGWFHRPGDPEPPPVTRASDTTPLRTWAEPLWQAQPLPVEIAHALAAAGDALRARLGFSPQHSADEVLAALTREVERLRAVRGGARLAAADGTLLGLAQVYGGLFVQHCAWHWVQLRGRGAMCLGVAAPEDQYCVRVSELLDVLIRQRQREITLTLQFNVAKTGHFPPARPGQLLELR